MESNIQKLKRKFLKSKRRKEYLIIHLKYYKAGVVLKVRYRHKNRRLIEGYQQDGKIVSFEPIIPMQTIHTYTHNYIKRLKITACLPT